MDTENGYFYLNLANEWPNFLLSNAVDIAPDGALRLKQLADESYELRGAFIGGPFETGESATDWYRLQAFADASGSGAHFQFFTYTGENSPQSDLNGETPFGGSGWLAAPLDLADLLILNPPARRLWIGGVMRGDGGASPALHQARVTYGRDTYIKYLPAIYRKNPASRDLLERFLSLHESLLGSIEGSIDDLPLLFDPEAAPSAGFPSWLNWLAGWLAFDLNERWSGEEARAFLAKAFGLYGERGTVQGLRHYLEIYAGVKAHIEEPGQSAVVWSLGETSSLGFTTMLAAGPLQGAVVSRTATLDGSHLTKAEDFGAALFEDVAHTFCVSVYCAELRRAGALSDLQAVIEREKPAYVVAHLRVIEPAMRVGAQARIGIDAIIANGPEPAQIGSNLDTVTLAEQGTPCEA